MSNNDSVKDNQLPATNGSIMCCYNTTNRKSAHVIDMSFLTCPKANPFHQSLAPKQNTVQNLKRVWTMESTKFGSFLL